MKISDALWNHWLLLQHNFYSNTTEKAKLEDCFFGQQSYMFLNHFLLADKNILPIIRNRVLIMYVPLYLHYFQMIKEKVYLVPENLDQLASLDLVFVFFWLFLIDIYSSYLFCFFFNLSHLIILLKTDLKCFNSS